MCTDASCLIYCEVLKENLNLKIGLSLLHSQSLSPHSQVSDHILQDYATVVCVESNMVAKCQPQSSCFKSLVYFQKVLLVFPQSCIKCFLKVTSTVITF